VLDEFWGATLISSRLNAIFTKVV